MTLFWRVTAAFAFYGICDAGMHVWGSDFDPLVKVICFGAFLMALADVLQVAVTGQSPLSESTS